MSLVTLEPGASQAVRSALAEKGVEGPIRIEVRSSGCCDPLLTLAVDKVRDSDLVEELDGVTFVMSPETHQLVGEVRMACADDAGRRGFVLTSSKPLSEWDGFAVQEIKV
jgi:Fe-S cluster assembly iron-binding protein IscA